MKWFGKCKERESVIREKEIHLKEYVLTQKKLRGKMK
jgi:hypothetical protein